MTQKVNNLALAIIDKEDGTVTEHTGDALIGVLASTRSAKGDGIPSTFMCVGTMNIVEMVSIVSGLMTNAVEAIVKNDANREISVIELHRTFNQAIHDGIRNGVRAQVEMKGGDPDIVDGLEELAKTLVDKLGPVLMKAMGEEGEQQ